ncbi:hypothetical protein [Cryobacterium sp. AP23]
MENNLVAAVPESNPDKDALIDYGLTAVNAFVPIVGSGIADLARGIIARKSEERQHAFDTLVALEVTRLAEQVAGITPQSMVESDEFMAAYAKASRVAAETESADKRQRLAAALTRMGPWSSIDPTRRQGLLDLVATYDDLQIFLLGYFRDPTAWLTANAPDWRPGKYMMAGIDTILGDYVFTNGTDWRPSVTTALARFPLDGVADVPLQASMTDAGTVQKRTTSFGDQLLDFIGKAVVSS